MLLLPAATKVICMKTFHDYANDAKTTWINYNNKAAVPLFGTNCTQLNSVILFAFAAF